MKSWIYLEPATFVGKMHLAVGVLVEGDGRHLKTALTLR